MYEEYYGLREKPFSIVPDPDFLFLSRTHKAAIEILETELCERGFTLLSGEVGSGKTLLIRHLIRLIGDRATVGVVTNTPRHSTSMLEWILLAFGLDFHGKERAEQHEALMRFLESQRAKKRQTVLIIDEAHNLDIPALEELPILLHLNTKNTVPVHLLLVGQPEIRETLNDPRGWQIAQLITLHFKLQPLTFRETRLYIQHRIRSVGGGPDIFDAEACAVIYLLSSGLPRLINTLCSSSLVYGQGEERTAIGGDMVIDIARGSATGGLVNIPGLDENFDADELRRRARKLCQNAGDQDQKEKEDPARRRLYFRETQNYPGMETEAGPPSLLPAVTGTAGRDKKPGLTNEPSLVRRNGEAELIDVSVDSHGDEPDLASIRRRRTRLRYMVFGEIALTALMAAAIVAVFVGTGPEDGGPDIVQHASDAGGAPSPPKPGPVASGPTTEDESVANRQPADPAHEKSDPPGKSTGEVVGKDTSNATLADSGPAIPILDTVGVPPPAEIVPAPPLAPGGAAADLPDPMLSADAFQAAPPRLPATAIPSPADGGPMNGVSEADGQPGPSLSRPPEEKILDAANADEPAAPPGPDMASLSTETAASGAKSANTPASRTEPAISVPVARSDAAPPAASTEPRPPAQADGSVPAPWNADADLAPAPVAPPMRIGGEVAAGPLPEVAAAPVPEVEVTALPLTRAAAPPSSLMAVLVRPGSGEFVEAIEELFAIWKMDYASLAGAAPCHKAFSAGLSCYEHEGTLATLGRIGLPAVIGLKLPGGDLAYAVLAGMGRSQVKLRIGDATVMASIGEVSSRLSGPFMLLWKSPIQFTGNMSEGSSGKEVRSLRDTLNRIMPEEFRPGEGADFDFNVTRAVKAFQRTHGLYADGVVGAETLISMNRVLYRGQLPELENL